MTDIQKLECLHRRDTRHSVAVAQCTDRRCESTRLVVVCSPCRPCVVALHSTRLYVLCSFQLVFFLNFDRYERTIKLHQVLQCDMFGLQPLNSYSTDLQIVQKLNMAQIDTRLQIDIQSILNIPMLSFGIDAISIRILLHQYRYWLESIVRIKTSQ